MRTMLIIGLRESMTFHVIFLMSSLILDWFEPTIGQSVNMIIPSFRSILVITHRLKVANIKFKLWYDIPEQPMK